MFYDSTFCLISYTLSVQEIKQVSTISEINSWINERKKGRKKISLREREIEEEKKKRSNTKKRQKIIYNVRRKKWNSKREKTDYIKSCSLPTFYSWKQSQN